MSNDISREAKELKKVTKKISDISDKTPYWSQSYIDIAKWHIREREIACLESRIDEHNQSCSCCEEFPDRCTRDEELQQQLTDLKGRKDDGEK